MTKDPFTHACAACGDIGRSNVMPENPQCLYHFTERDPSAPQVSFFPYLHLRCIPRYLEAEPSRALSAFDEALYSATLDLEDRLRRSIELTKRGPRSNA